MRYSKPVNVTFHKYFIFILLSDHSLNVCISLILFGSANVFIMSSVSFWLFLWWTTEAEYRATVLSIFYWFSGIKTTHVWDRKSLSLSWTGSGLSSLLANKPKMLLAVLTIVLTKCFNNWSLLNHNSSDLVPPSFVDLTLQVVLLKFCWSQQQWYVSN